LLLNGRGRQARRAEGAPLKPYRKLSQVTFVTDVFVTDIRPARSSIPN